MLIKAKGVLHLDLPYPSQNGHHQENTKQHSSDVGGEGWVQENLKLDTEIVCYSTRSKTLGIK